MHQTAAIAASNRRDAKSWTAFTAGQTESLGAGASFKIIYTDDTPHLADANQNSLVLRLSLGKTDLLVMGDAQAGTRATPNAGTLEQTEKVLIASPDIKGITIMQIGHHGSSTSSRAGSPSRLRSST
jgi:beta-lactamase superfamily II metal-dependent hydrolase